MGLVAEEKKLLLFTIWITIRSNIFPHPSYIIYPSMERFLALPQSLPPKKKFFFLDPRTIHRLFTRITRIYIYVAVPLYL